MSLFLTTSGARSPSKGIRKRRWGKTLRDFWKRLLRPPGGLREDCEQPARMVRFSYRLFDNTPVSFVADFWRSAEDHHIGMGSKDGEVDVPMKGDYHEKARKIIMRKTGAWDAQFHTDLP